MTEKAEQRPRPPMKIVGIIKKNTNLLFVVQFGDSPTSFLVARESIEKEYPDELIAFYERNLTFI
jgi:hypothetical protein